MLTCQRSVFIDIYTTRQEWCSKNDTVPHMLLRLLPFLWLDYYPTTQPWPSGYCFVPFPRTPPIRSYKKPKGRSQHLIANDYQVSPPPKKGPVRRLPEKTTKVRNYYYSPCLCRFGIFSLWTLRRCWIKLSGRLNPLFPFLLHLWCGQSHLFFSKSTGILLAVPPMLWIPVGQFSTNGEELLDPWTLRRCLWRLFLVENVMSHLSHLTRDWDALIQN